MTAEAVLLFGARVLVTAAAERQPTRGESANFRQAADLITKGEVARIT